MDRWSKEYRAFALEAYFKNNDSPTQTQRVFRNHFNLKRNGKVPTRQIIINWVKTFITMHQPRQEATRSPYKHTKPDNVERDRGFSAESLSVCSSAVTSFGCIRQKCSMNVTF